MFQQSATTAGTDQATGTSTADGSGTEASPTGEADGEPVIELGESELVVDESRFSTDVYVSVAVENVGAGHSGTLEVVADWYNDAGEYMGNDSAFLNSLGPGEIWAARVYYLGGSGEEVNDYEVAGEYNVEPPDMNPDGLSLLESELQVGEDEAVVSGRVENRRTEPVSYIEATAKLYDAEGVVLGDEWTNVTDVPAGEVWAFELTWLAFGRAQDVAEHSMWLEDSAL